MAAALTRRDLPQQLATPVPLLAILAAMAAAAIIGMDRLRVRVGRSEIDRSVTAWAQHAERRTV